MAPVNFAQTSTRILLRFASTHSSAVASRLRSREVLLPASLHNVGDLAAWIRGRYRVVEDADVRLQWKGRPLASTRTLASVVGRRGAAAQPPLLEVLCAAPAPPTAAPTAAGRPSKKRPRDATAETAPEPTPRSRRRSAESLDSVASADVERPAYSPTYPMSEYDDDDEPLHCLPLLPDHKRHLVPSWARPESAWLRAAAASQDADGAAVFGAPSATCDLRPIFGRSPAAPRGRAARPPDSSDSERWSPPRPPRTPRASTPRDDDLEASSPSQWPSAAGRGPAKDVALVVVAASDLKPPGRGVAVARGHRYPTVMRDVDTFGNLRRHYAKHNALRETELALFHGGAKLPLLACARDRGLAGDATIEVRHQPRGADAAERCAPRRISSTSSDEGARAAI